MKPSLAVIVTLFALTACAEEPWGPSGLIQPETLAARLTNPSAAKPAIFYIGFPVLYHGAHITGAILVGAASKPEGLEALRQAVAKLPHDSEIVIYCGCCPFDRCPNVRPAYTELRKLGFTKVSVLSLPTNTSKDWTAKGYPIERASGK